MPDYVRYSAGVESIAPDEAETIDRIITVMGEGGEATRGRYGRHVRTSHAKAHAFLRGELKVHDGLPPELAQGLFARAATYPVVVRMAQVPGELLHDRRVSTPRGMAIKIVGVEGEKLPGHAGATQDFVLDTGTVFNTPDIATFLSAITATEMATPMPELVKAAVSNASRITNAALNAVGLNSANLDFYGHPRLHPLAEPYFSQCAIRYGDYVAKIGVFPDEAVLHAARAAGIDPGDRHALRTAMRAWFAENPATFDVRVQLCMDLQTMPVEDASIDWPQDESPYRTVATLTLPRQDAWTYARREVVDEDMLFSPSHSLAAHRPLGGIMRARMRAYEALGNRRRRGNGRTLNEPVDLSGVPVEAPVPVLQARKRRRSALLPVAATVGTLVAGVAAAWLYNQQREEPLERRTRARLRPRGPHHQVPSAADIRVR